MMLERNAIDRTCHLEAELPQLRRFARALGRNDTAADGLVQETLAHALSRLQLWNEGADFRAWVFTILYNQHNRSASQVDRERKALLIWKQETAPSYATLQYQWLELRDLERALE